MRHHAPLAFLFEFFLALGCLCRPCGFACCGLFFLGHSLLRFSFVVCEPAQRPAGWATQPISTRPTLPRNLLLSCHATLPWTLAGARVGVRALAANREIPAVPQAAITLNLDEPANIHLDLFAEIPFHATLGFDGLTKAVNLFFREILNFFGGLNTGLGTQRTSASQSDPIDRSQSDPKSLLRRKIHTCATCHAGSLSLPLLVFGVGANHPDHTAPVDDLALITNLFHRRTYFHDCLSFAAWAERLFYL